MRALLYLLTLLSLAAAPAAVARKEPISRGGAGMAALEPPGGETPPDLVRLALPDGLRTVLPKAPCYLLVPASKADLLDPPRLEPLVAEGQERGLRVIVRLMDDDWQSIDDWSSRITLFAQQLAGRVDAYQLFGPGAFGTPPREYAFLLKNARVAVRAAGSSALIAGAPLEPAGLSWAEALFEEDSAPYIDVLTARDLGGLDGVIALRDRLDPRSAVWVTDAEPSVSAPLPSAAAAYIEARAAGAELVIFKSALSGVGELVSSLRSAFPPRLHPAAAGALPFDPARAASGGDNPEPLAVVVLPFFDSESREGIAAYRLPEAAADVPASPAPAALRLRLRAPVESLEILAPESGEARAISAEAPAGAIVELPVRRTYLMLRYRVAVTAAPLKERAQVGAHSELSAEEIIAREREVRGIQEVRLRHYEAKATLAIHYRIASLNESIDLSTENRLFVKEGKQDYQQTALYVNGALWRGKQPPYLPYLDAGKVGEVPLDIAIDERYRYILEGRQETDGRDCYVLSFEPTDTTGSLYRGRVYIDTRLFTRVKMEAVQTGLAAPVRSNEVVFHYRPVPAPWGDAWLPESMTGQMTFELLGFNLVVEKGARYSDYQTDLDGFEERRSEAYDSGRPLFRDNGLGGGLQRLNIKDGQEELSPLDNPRNTLLVFGASVGEDGNFNYPFAGVNFFDYNFHNTGTQFNLTWAGPFADISWTLPNIFHRPPGRRPPSLSLQGTLSAFESEDTLATSEGSPDEEAIDVLREAVRASFGVPMGNFLKWTFDATMLYENFDTRHDETADDFVLPVSNVQGGLSARLEYARLGYIASAWGEASRRNRWAPWGLPDQEYSDDDIDFTRLTLTFRKALYFGTYQKLIFGVTGYEGRGLDRFSRFELGDFRSARVRGFNGSGIHFDRGLVGDLSYSFPLGRSLRADVGVQAAQVQSEEDFGPGYERVIGSGLNLEFSGPWSTFVTVRVSRALSSTIPGTGGGGDLRVVFFRTFDRWSRKGTRGTPLPDPYSATSK